MSEAPVDNMLGVMTLEAFIERYDVDGPFEIIDGEIITLSPNLMGHVDISEIIADFLKAHVKPRKLGRVFKEAPFVLSYSSDWVTGSRVPDVMFVSMERFNAYTALEPDWREKPLLIVPDIVVEIISKNDHYPDVTDKVARYLNDGVKIVWVLDPKLRKIVVHTAGGIPHTLTEKDMLDGGDVLPELRIAVAEIFGV